jgi:thioredoxin 1
MTAGEVIHLTEDSFDTALQGGTPVLVDFWAEWCGPCRMIGPILDELAKEYGESLVIAKVNVDDNQALAQRFGISSIPNLKVFKGGVEVDNIIGAAPKPTIKRVIDQHI